MKRLQINPTTWEELARDRPTWRRTVKTGAAIYEASRIAVSKAKRKTRKSQPRPVRNADAQPLPMCPRGRRTFRARTGLIGHLRINCTSRTAPTVVPPPTSSPSSPPPTNSGQSSVPPLPSSSYSSSSTAPTMAVQAAVTHSNNPDTTADTTPLPPTPAMRTRTTAVHTVTAPPPHASAWSVTCESIAQRLANQCPEHQPTPTALASTAHTALALSRIALVSSTTCASTNTCGRPPPAAPHHHTLPPSPPPAPPHHASTLTHRKHQTATCHASGKCASRLNLHEAELAGHSYETRCLHSLWDKFFIENGILFHLDNEQYPKRVVLPLSMVDDVVERMHAKLGHSGIHLTEWAFR
nr:unnamed protein product [Spirometra erinaceieuropaei]